MDQKDIKRRLAAILVADVKGYSKLMRDDETATVQTLNEYLKVMTLLVEQHHGRVVNQTGDNMLAEFFSVVDAVQGAVAIQKELKVRNGELPFHRIMQFRIGINLGDVIVDDDDQIFGDGVNIAARLEGLSEPGGICISRTAFDQIEDKLPLGYEYLGERNVKNISKPVRAYRVLLDVVDTQRDAEPEPQRESDTGGGTWPSESFWEQLLKQKKSKHGRRTRERFIQKARFFGGILAVLFVIDILTGGGLWVQWPALAFGFLLFLSWNRGFEDNETDGKKQGSTRAERVYENVSKNGPKYLRIRVEPKGSADDPIGKLNIKVPVALLTAGVKLGSILPEHAKERINAALKEHGFDYDLTTMNKEKLDRLLQALSKGSLRMEKDNREIRFSCE